MDRRVDGFLRLVGFVALLAVWFRAAAVLTFLPLTGLPDPVASLLFPAWMLLPFLLLGAYYHLRGDPDRDGVAGDATR